MLAFLANFPWYFWFILVVAIVYIFLILWFCLGRAPNAYNGKNPKICLLISALTIFLIVGSILMIVFII